MRHRVVGLFSVIMMVAAVVGSSVAPAGGVAGFGDVQPARFYTDAVQWMVDSSITTGTSRACFSPDDPVTRGQAAAFLWRIAERPSGAPPHQFDDVVAAWQQEPVSWMFDEGITTGTTATTYSPDDLLTRGQMAALIWRAAGRPGAAPTTFPDVVKVWQLVPVGWMEAEAITTGTSPDTFSPEDPVTRGQFATFAWRWQGRPAVVVDDASPLCAGRDEFDGGLQAGWTWAAGDPGLRSFTEMHGYLSMGAAGDFDANVLLREPVAADYVIETKVHYSPVANFQAAGLTIEEAAGFENAVTIARGFCSVCTGDGIYIDNIVDGVFDSAWVPVPAGTGDVWLRIEHESGTYTFSSSRDGSNWFDLGFVERVLVEPRTGLFNGRSEVGSAPTAHFDYFAEREI